MPFLLLMILGVLVLAGNVIFFSVWGLTQTFTMTALFWGSAIEGAKLIIASFLYRARKELGLIAKAFGWFLVISMMIITSLGIYGHILSGYQEKEAEIRSQEIRVMDVTDTVSRFDERINDITEEINNVRAEISVMNQNISDISTRDDGFITARSRAADVIRQDRQDLQLRLDTLIQHRESIFEEREPFRERLILLQGEMLDVETKVGPIITLIELLGASGERAMLWFILLIVLVFDPAAVYLTIQANRVALSLKREKDEKLTQATKILENSPSPEEIDELQNSGAVTKEVLELVRKLSHESEKNSENVNEIRNKISHTEKRDNLKKQLLRD